MLDLRSLKDLARSNFSASHPLRQVLQLEDDWVTTGEFLMKLRLWLRLVDAGLHSG